MHSCPDTDIDPDHLVVFFSRTLVSECLSPPRCLCRNGCPAIDQDTIRGGGGRNTPRYFTIVKLEKRAELIY